MGISKPRNRAAAAALALTAAAILFLLPASLASAVTFTNACKNSLSSFRDSQVGVDITATASPNPVSPGGTVTLSNINQTLTVPGKIFVDGYNLGLLLVGQNNIPADVFTVIDGDNTVEVQQNTNMASTTISTVITDPNGDPGSGDESATDGLLSATYNNQTWTAGASGTVGFREHTDPAITGVSGGGIQVVAHFGGFFGGIFDVQFHCSPGTVTGPYPYVFTFLDPAPSFASTQIESQAGNHGGGGGQPPGLLGYEGQPGNQGGHHP